MLSWKRNESGQVETGAGLLSKDFLLATKLIPVSRTILKFTTDSSVAGSIIASPRCPHPNLESMNMSG